MQSGSSHPRPQRGLPLDALSAHLRNLRAVRRTDVEWGDTIVVRTRNSTYYLSPTGENRFIVRGGWFETQHRRPVSIRIHGCTFGGYAICSDILAAPGLFLEFGNGVLTTRIQEIGLLPAVSDRSTN